MGGGGGVMRLFGASEISLLVQVYNGEAGTEGRFLFGKKKTSDFSGARTETSAVCAIINRSGRLELAHKEGHNRSLWEMAANILLRMNEASLEKKETGLLDILEMHLVAVSWINTPCSHVPTPPSPQDWEPGNSVPVKCTPCYKVDIQVFLIRPLLDYVRLD